MSELTELIKAERSAADLNGYYEGSMGTGADYNNAKAATDAAIANLTAVSLPDRETLAHVLNESYDSVTGMGVTDEQWLSAADAVLAALSTQPAAGEVEWEYGWNTGSTFMVIGSREDAEQWLDQFGAKPGVGDWGSRLRRRRRAPEPDTWAEVPTMPAPEPAELFPGTLAALDHLSIRPEVQ